MLLQTPPVWAAFAVSVEFCMGRCLQLDDYGSLALERVREYAKKNCQNQVQYIHQLCEAFGMSTETVVKRVLSNPITINFHIDRISNNGKTILENLLEQGSYCGQFQTGISNGMLGGARKSWERRIFFDAYPEEVKSRPKYGAVNVLSYLDGASARFGACFFQMKKSVAARCTFSYGDSSTNPTILCTSDTFETVLAELFQDVDKNCRLLNQAVSSRQEAISVLFHQREGREQLGRNLDFCLEAHLHGEVSLSRDVESLHLDDSYRGTEFEGQAEKLCKKYQIALVWIPKRQIWVNEIEDFFRGPKIRALAQKIDAVFGNRQGILHAYLLGKASRDCSQHLEHWHAFGDEAACFQLFKQLWHTLAFWG